MNQSMDSMMWKTTHRFGMFMLALLLFFAAYEVGHDEELNNVLRVGGTGLLGLFGLLALIKCLRPGSKEERSGASTDARRLRKEHG